MSNRIKAVVAAVGIAIALAGCQFNGDDASPDIEVVTVDLPGGGAVLCVWGSTSETKGSLSCDWGN